MIIFFLNYCSLICVVVMLIYAGYKLATLIQRSEYNIIQQLYEFKFNKNDKFGEDDGFAIAGAITDFDGSPDSIEDPTIGTTEFYVKYWDEASDGAKFKKLNHRLCTNSDFDGSGLKLVLGHWLRL